MVPVTDTFCISEAFLACSQTAFFVVIVGCCSTTWMPLVIWLQPEIGDLGCNNTEEPSTNLVGFSLCAACNDLSDLIEEAFICPRIVGEAINA